MQSIGVRVPELEDAYGERRPHLRQVPPVRGDPGGPAALPRRGLLRYAVTQPTGTRNYGGGEAASQQLGSAGAQEVPPGHTGLPLLALCPGVLGSPHLPVP